LKEYHKEELNTMARYLLIWSLDPARIPVDSKERAAGWSGLMGMDEYGFNRGALYCCEPGFLDVNILQTHC
jgi:hypothetical protein